MVHMLPGLEPIVARSRVPISSEVTRRLLDFLISGQIQPGERLPSERTLAESLGVGRSHVREAIKSLAVLGLIDVRQGDGTYLKRVDSPLLPLAIQWGLLLGAKQTQDLVEARSQLEMLVVGLAAQRRDDAALEELRRCLEIMHTTTDNDEFVKADVAFHLQISQAAGNQSLLQIMRSIRGLLEVWISRVAHAPGTRPVTWAEHAAVFDAIERADPAAARRAMQAHMDGATERLRGTLGEQELPRDRPADTPTAPKAPTGAA
jgi:GntR family transcriptional repressor for pyruvate dehydrogenase complex